MEYVFELLDFLFDRGFCFASFFKLGIFIYPNDRFGLNDRAVGKAYKSQQKVGDSAETAADFYI